MRHPRLPTNRVKRLAVLALALTSLINWVGIQAPGLAPRRARAQGFESGHKEEMLARMIELDATITELKPQAAANPDDKNLASRLADAIREYDSLSAQLGGDRAPSAEQPGGKNPPASEAPGVAPAAPPGCTAATTTTTNSTPVAILDNTTVTSTIVVAGVNPYLLDVDLTTNITHTFAGDLDITLTSPAGTVVTLTTDNGGGNDNVFNGTVWDDDGGAANPPGAVTDTVFANNVVETPLVPEEAMGAFIGENPNGTWTLSIGDDATGDTGSLDSWSLAITALTAAPTDATTTTTNSTPVAILDNTTVTSNLVIAGAGTYLRDVNLTTFITHTFAGDLDITLTSPAGTVVTLTTDNGGGNDNVFNGTLWDDSGGTANPPGAITDTTFANNVVETPLVPEEAMGAFIGEDPNGTWTLSIGDDAGGDTGSLDSWSLDIVTSSCAATCAITCPPNQTGNTTPGQPCCGIVNYPAPTTTGDCGTITCSPASGSCFPVGVTTVTCTTTPGPSCTFTVTVADNEPPTITCPSNINTAAAVSCPIATSSVVTFPPPVVTDNCPGVTVVCTPPSGSTLPIGCTTVTCTATDSSGNTATCSFQICVFSFCLQDETNPGNVVLVNTQTGDYIFCCSGLFVASGRGIVTLRGCAGTIEDNKGDRKVEIRFDTSVDGNRGNGSATIKIGTVIRCQITDLNMSNNTCVCSTNPPAGRLDLK